MKITYPISTDEGDDYLVLLESFEKSVFPEEITKTLGNVDVMDITLIRVSGTQTTNPGILFDISRFIAGFLGDNDNVILYFYCDDMHEITRRDKTITPQKFRSRLFSHMFDRYTRTRNIKDFINIPLEIKADRDIYIHLISKKEYISFVNIIKDSIVELASKD